MIGKLKFDIEWRKGNICFRAKDGVDRDPEIVVYQQHPEDPEKESCYTIAFFRESREGYDIETVGRRLFDALKEYHIPYDEFINAVDYFHQMLDKIHELRRIAAQDS